MSKQKTLLDFMKKGAKDHRNTESEDTKPSLDVKKDNVSGVESLKRSEEIEKEKNSVSESPQHQILSSSYSVKKLVYHDVKAYIPSTIDLENPRIVKFYKQIQILDKADYVFLLDVDYDSETGKAVLVFYDVIQNDILYWYDKTGHKPYFLTDVPPDKVSKISEIVRHKSFDSIETVEKIDLLRGTTRRFTKIVTKDPLAVRYLRSKVPAAWEANIKYHVNYLYDLGLIPGMPYKVDGSSIEEIVEVDKEKLKKNLVDALDINKLESTETAINLAKLFETKWISARRVAVDIEVYTPFEGKIPSPDQALYPVMSIAFASNDGLKKVLVLHRENLKILHPIQEEDVEVEIFDSEIALLLEALSILSQYPVVITFNGDNFDLRYLYMRALKLGIPKEFIGIKIKKVLKGNSVENIAKLTMALHIDLYKFFNNKAIQIYAFEGRYKEVNLDSVAQALLKVGKVQLDEELSKVDLSTLIKYNMRDAQITLALTTFSDELVWKLMLLIMRISKLGLEDVCRTTVSVWIKNLFYWEHRRKGFLIPRSEDIITLKGKKVTEAIIKGKKYAGAIVIEPPQGIFFNIVVLDFASLYPSIIKRWNLSYETIDPDEKTCSKIVDVIDEKNAVIHRVCVDRTGITSEIVGLLRDFRVKLYKKKAKDKNLDSIYRGWYDVVQRAMKVYINAAYGVFGAETFSLYAPSVAESVTAIGRRVISTTISKAEELGLKVVYGDTDSLFVWNPESTKLEELRKWVEEVYGLELEIDKTYKFVAFALKKNYVGVQSTGEMDIKGMIGKKRNTPDFIKNLFSEIVEQIASINEPEDAIKVIDSVRNTLEKYYLFLKHKLLALDEVAFHIGLTKSLSEYKKTTPQHVKAALMLQKYGIEISPGDIITYVKVKSKEGVKPIQLARIGELDVQKYVEAMRSTLEQLFTALNISWEDIAGGSSKLV